MSSSWKEHVDSLLAWDGDPPLVSMYLPAPAGAEANASNRIRLKNAIRQARHSMRHAGVADRTATEVLAPAVTFLDELGQVQRAGEGLALFAGRQHWQYLDTPVSMPELTSVSGRYYVKPLFACHGDYRFQILALSQNRVRLLRADWQGASEFSLEQVPDSLTGALGEELTERHLQYHTGAGPRRTSKSPIYHGQGGGGDEYKDEAYAFVRRVEDGLRDAPRDPECPLVLAGVDFLLAMFRELSDHPRLLAAQIQGNADALSEAELHARAWPMVLADCSADREAAAHHCLAAVERGDGSRCVAEILPAAAQGRVDELFVALDECIWGHFDAERGRVERHDERRPTSDDLLELAVRQVHARGGSVHAVPRNRMPGGAACVASFRY